MSHLFGSWFRKKKLDHPVDLSPLVTDMHSHLIPGIDDGAPDMATVLALLEQLAGLGYQKVITTPHIMADLYKNTREIIEKGEREVKKAIEKAGINIEFHATAEYLIDEGFAPLIASKEVMTFGQNYVLVELPYYSPPQNLSELLFEMQVAGYRVILAHPERYVYWHHNFSKLEELKDREVFFQLNTISLSGYYSLTTKKISEKLIDAGMIDFLGSDLHSFQYLKLLEKSLFEPALEKLLNSGKLKNQTL
ncbi:MAG: CpsB/CapC family capsule biosynthesis tyrosine phosphatase [Bacteroides sp.]|jgi:tyrosine-protein phosphatase YwqE|nr:CpsB/CapC family capsule biosynthesis tyrosine phosphatase [Bacteroides sp.]